MRIRFTTNRPPPCRLELLLQGSLVYTRNEELHLQISAGVRNSGSAAQTLQQEGTRCQVVAVRKDLSELAVRIFPVFQLRDGVAPGETLGDLKLCRVAMPLDDVVWVRINFRLVSDGTEWNASCVMPIDPTRTMTHHEPGADAHMLAIGHGPIRERRELTLQIERQKKEQVEQDRKPALTARPRPIAARPVLASRLAEPPLLPSEDLETRGS